ncbi:TetR/AcrR family transcriptional regulator [Aestuariibacter sp. A3R04]|nr:TetR/AcrR family transcriptional regulator [Aestuariibacter sp. A3R04]MBU3023880.1 TetR/AcrR family transcriptional regulator [Aestuariibacter sp. A3R04]
MKLSEQKKLSILQAAENLFFEQGMENTSMDLVAQEAKVSKRTLYNHFETKDALFHAILLRLQNQLRTGHVITYDPAFPVETQLHAIAQQEAAFLTSVPLLKVARVAFMHMLQQPALAQKLTANKMGCAAFLDEFLRDAVNAESLIIHDIPFAAKQFIYQLKSFIFYPNLYQFDIPDDKEIAMIVEQTVAMFTARYGTTPKTG